MERSSAVQVSERDGQPLSSLISLPCQHFAKLASYLLWIETTINTLLECPNANTKVIERDM